jgi:hypothetical protein
VITAALDAIGNLSFRTKLESLAVVVAVAAGGLWWVTRDPAPVPEDTAPAPMVRQADESVVAERTFTPKPKPAPHAIPKGYVESRRETVHVDFDTPKNEAEIVVSLATKGNEVRAIASSPDGTVTYAQDSIIVPQLMPAPERPWAAGVSYSTDRQTGVWLERDIGRLRLGAEVSKGQGKPRAELRVGVAF